jgi:hypothetical protein
MLLYRLIPAALAVGSKLPQVGMTEIKKCCAGVILLDLIEQLDDQRHTAAADQNVVEHIQMVEIGVTVVTFQCFETGAVTLVHLGDLSLGDILDDFPQRQHLQGGVNGIYLFHLFFAELRANHCTLPRLVNHQLILLQHPDLFTDWSTAHVEYFCVCRFYQPLIRLDCTAEYRLTQLLINAFPLGVFPVQWGQNSPFPPPTYNFSFIIDTNTTSVNILQSISTNAIKKIPSFRQIHPYFALAYYQEKHSGGNLFSLQKRLSAFCGVILLFAGIF